MSLAIAAFAAALAGSAEPDALSVQALHNFGRCIVARTPEGARRVLAMDYRQEDYGKQLRAIAKGHDHCLTPGSRLESDGVLLAGALAEALLEHEVEAEALVPRLAPDPARQVIAARDETETMAVCTVFAKPQAVTRLLATEPATRVEAQAISELVPAVGECLKSGARLTLNRPALRSLLALAAWRVVSTPRVSQ